MNVLPNMQQSSLCTFMSDILHFLCAINKRHHKHDTRFLCVNVASVMGCRLKKKLNTRNNLSPESILSRTKKHLASFTPRCKRGVGNPCFAKVSRTTFKWRCAALVICSGCQCHANGTPNAQCDCLHQTAWYRVPMRSSRSASCKATHAPLFAAVRHFNPFK